ncbi:secreted antigen 1 [Babesia caballi]|uniref:Secreted antigen 1 n=1 Tax=Babesia caballi TaxID=5871 RepID=A0AAV4LMJ2_BABCB|nr:secreted antigen 1 [Babesia caballi]
MLFSGTLFLKPSLPDLTSTFLVFVNEICTILSGDGVRDHEVEGYGIVSRKKLKKDFEKQYPNFPDYAPLTQCCSSLKTNIEKLIGDDSSDGALRIPNSSRKMYENMLQSKNFPTYVKWLSQHIPKLIANLQKMKAECRSWNPSDMSNGQAAGPFPYGFGFSSKWSNGQEVQYDLSKLTAEGSDGLPALRSHVENLIGSSTSSSAGSIAGGLLGTAAMGGMGTAVALNVGGVTTALKGAIGIFK